MVADWIEVECLAYTIYLMGVAGVFLLFSSIIVVEYRSANMYCTS